MKTILFSLLIVLSFVIFISCGDDTVTPPPPGPPSDLTRSGKFIAFTSNLAGNYDIWLAQVNSSGQLEDSGLVFGENPHNLTAANTENDKQSNWSPNGRVLVFSRVSGNIQEIYAFFFAENGRLDSTSQKSQMLFLQESTG
jgi:Tol biopolymer transport system component